MHFACKEKVTPRLISRARVYILYVCMHSIWFTFLSNFLVLISYSFVACCIDHCTWYYVCEKCDLQPSINGCTCQSLNIDFPFLLDIDTIYLRPASGRSIVYKRMVSKKYMLFRQWTWRRLRLIMMWIVHLWILSSFLQTCEHMHEMTSKYFIFFSFTSCKFAGGPFPVMLGVWWGEGGTQ